MAIQVARASAAGQVTLPARTPAPGPWPGASIDPAITAPNDPAADAAHAAHEAEEARRDADPNQRGALAKWATATAYFGGMAKGLTMDRGRLIAAFPHAREAGLTKKWALELAWGKITNDVVPVAGGTLAVRGKVLTTNAWGRAYATSNAMSMALHGVGMLYGIPNLYDGYQKEGLDGFVNTRPGRTGVLATSGMLIDFAIMGAALASLPKGGRTFSAMMQVKWMSNSAIVFGKAALGAPCLANELGMFDFLNKGDDRAVLETWGDAVQKLGGSIPIVRDHVGEQVAPAPTPTSPTE